MFWFWAFASMLGYAVQNVLLAKSVRRMDALSAGFYRNISFVISFFPVLFLVPAGSWSGLLTVLPLVVLAAMLAAISLWTRFLSWSYFPLGVSSGSIMGFNVLLSWGLGWLYLGEVLSWPMLLALLAILSGSVMLAFFKGSHRHLKSASLYKGMALILCTSLTITMAFILVAQTAREANPLLVAYAWEVLIAPAALGLLWIKGQAGKGGKLERISWAEFYKILWCASPTVLGTVGYTLAIQHGTVAITAAISATGIFVITALGAWFCNEPLKPRYYIAMTVTVAGVIALKLLS